MGALLLSNYYYFYLHLQLAYCIVQFLEKDPTLTELVRVMILLVDILMCKNATLSISHSKM